MPHAIVKITSLLHEPLVKMGPGVTSSGWRTSVAFQVTSPLLSHHAALTLPLLTQRHLLCRACRAGVCAPGVRHPNVTLKLPRLPRLTPSPASNTSHRAHHRVAKMPVFPSDAEQWVFWASATHHLLSYVFGKARVDSFSFWPLNL